MEDRQPYSPVHQSETQNRPKSSHGLGASARMGRWKNYERASSWPHRQRRASKRYSAPLHQGSELHQRAFIVICILSQFQSVRFGIIYLTKVSDLRESRNAQRVQHVAFVPIFKVTKK